MAVENTPLDRRIPPKIVGVLALIAAFLSLAIYVTRGHWPARMGGLGVALFVGMAIVLIVHN